MFNEDKGFKIGANDKYIGTCRVLRKGTQRGRQAEVYMVIHIGKIYRSDDELIRDVMAEMTWVKGILRERYRCAVHMMMNFLPPMKDFGYGFAVEPSQQFGSTARQRSSSVLIDEATSKPLY